jgi:hypothetical protein
MTGWTDLAGLILRDPLSESSDIFLGRVWA